MTVSVSWLKLWPAAARGASTTSKQSSVECDEPGRWLVGDLFVCQRHAALVATDLGDDIGAIEADWLAQL